MVRHFRVALGAAALAAVAVPALAQSGNNPGKAPYDRVCGVCHGPDGQGNVAPALVPLEKDFDEVLAIVREGRGEMPPQSANAVSDDALKLIVGTSGHSRRNQPLARVAPLPAGARNRRLTTLSRIFLASSRTSSASPSRPYMSSTRIILIPSSRS